MAILLLCVFIYWVHLKAEAMENKKKEATRTVKDTANWIIKSQNISNQ